MAPQLRLSNMIGDQKYRMKGETHEQMCQRLAHSLTDRSMNEDVAYEFLEGQAILFGGRVNAAMGTGKDVTPYNCFVSRTIEDSIESILAAHNEAVQTMRLGGGIGYNFSNIRPEGSEIKSLGSTATGPVSFMEMFDAACKTIRSAGHRRGAMMGCLRVDHPDIRKFIHAKKDQVTLTQFNLSVLVTDEFMEAVENDDLFPLVFDGEVWEWITARELWDEITESTWDWAEPGVIFIDRINDWNNLWYAETIEATNPCAEQPLPPFGACLLGSLNLVKFLVEDQQGNWVFDWDAFSDAVEYTVRMLDNVIDQAHYPLEQQRREAKEKRRMGIGITGLANTVEALGMPYGSPDAVGWTEEVMNHLNHVAYFTSTELAYEKGPFPEFNAEKYLRSKFVQERIDPAIKAQIMKHGIRNSHLTSIAPTGTISLHADNVSSGVEPPFDYGYWRDLNTDEGLVTEFVADYGSKHLGVRGMTTNDLTVDQHIAMLCAAQKYTDSSVSKTVNVGSLVTFPQFQDIYRKAYYGGAKSCSTFRIDGKRFGLLQKVQEDSTCEIDPTTGKADCGE